MAERPKLTASSTKKPKAEVGMTFMSISGPDDGRGGTIGALVGFHVCGKWPSRDDRSTTCTLLAGHKGQCTYGIPATEVPRG